MTQILLIGPLCMFSNERERERERERREEGDTTERKRERNSEALLSRVILLKLEILHTRHNSSRLII